MSKQPTLDRGSDALGTRYMRADLGACEVMILIHDNDVLLEPGLTERVKLAAELALDQLRVSTPARRT